MATRAVQRTRREKTSEESSGGGPKRWWQWFFIYPALGASLLTAAPSWYDKFKAPPGSKSLAESEKQKLLWEKNRVCASLPFKGFLNPSNVAVDATICDSGDVLIAAVTPQNVQAYRWLALEDILPKPGDGGVIPAAHAADFAAQLSRSINARQSTVKLAQFQVTVLCQRMDGNLLKRRISTPQGCFDEVIDTYTGKVVSKAPAPCVAQC